MDPQIFLDNLDNLDFNIDSEIQNYLSEVYTGSSDSYSRDYPHLQKNWEILSRLAGTTPKKILFLDDFNFDDSTLSKICEKLTKKGYCIRRRREFIPCEKCSCVIPCIEVWKTMKEKSIPVPKVWKKTCSEC